MNDWKREAARLYFDEHRTWGEIIARLQGNFPGKNASQIRDIIRDPIRRDPRYKGQRQDGPEYKASNGWKNGTPAGIRWRDAHNGVVCVVGRAGAARDVV